MESVTGQLIDQLRDVFEILPDPRRGKNIQYSFADIAMAAFSVFHMLCSSFLHYQRVMDSEQGRNNCQSLYQMQRIPCDNHIRAKLDGLQPKALKEAFAIAPKLIVQHPKIHRKFQILNQRTLIAVDGTQFHSSYKIHCDQCLTRNHRSTGTEYHHNALVLAMVALSEPRIVPLMAEFITSQDGDSKQDCENKAFKRWLQSQGEEFDAKYRPLYLGDDL